MTLPILLTILFNFCQISLALLASSVRRPLSLCHTKRFLTDYERLKNTKIGEKIGEKISEKIVHVILGNRSKVNDLGVTQPDY